MCLIKIEETAKIATAPIKVYKVLTADNCSPFQNQQYHVGKNTPKGHDILSGAGLTIDGGYLHAYLSLSKASENLSGWHPVFSRFTRLKIVEMYIPEGTEYWLGAGLEVAADCLEWPANSKELQLPDVRDNSKQNKIKVRTI